MAEKSGGGISIWSIIFWITAIIYAWNHIGGESKTEVKVKQDKPIITEEQQKELTETVKRVTDAMQKVKNEIVKSQNEEEIELQEESEVHEETPKDPERKEQLKRL